MLDRSVERTFFSTVSAIWRRKFVFALTWILVFAAMVLGVLTLQPIFEGTTLLISGQASLAITSPNARQVTESPQTLMRIAESDEVLRQAAEAVGLDRLAPQLGPTRPSTFEILRRRLVSTTPERPMADDPVGAALPRVHGQLRVRAEPTSGVISISFRHEDASVATLFANAVAQAFVDRQVALYSRPGAVEFFMGQQRRVDQEFAAASARLEQFSRTTQVFAADEQRQLLLRRLNELNTNLALTRNTIADKLGQRQALGDQLRRLAPVARSSYVSSLVDSLSGERAAGAVPRAAENRAVEERSGDPPLLLIRVYQDSMVALFRINSELQGAQNGQRQLQEEQERLAADLNRLAEASEEFARLRRAVDQAAANSDLNARRMMEEQINAELSAARFSSVRVLERATQPLRPVFPNYMVTIAAAAIAALVLAVMAALLVHFVAGWKARARRAG